MVMYQKVLIQSAPSILAASYTSSDMLSTPARMKMHMKGVRTQLRRRQ